MFRFFGCPDKCSVFFCCPGNGSVPSVVFFGGSICSVSSAFLTGSHMPCHCLQISQCLFLNCSRELQAVILRTTPVTQTPGAVVAVNKSKWTKVKFCFPGVCLSLLVGLCVLFRS